MNKGFGLLGIIIVGAVIASAALGGGFYWNETKKQESLLNTGQDAIERAEELKKVIENRNNELVDTSDWKTYRNVEYGFEVKYAVEDVVTTTSNRGINMKFSVPGKGVYTQLVVEDESDMYCLFALCNVTPVSSVTYGGVHWDYLGANKYCDVGKCTSEQSVYRTVSDKDRYLLLFSGRSKEEEKEVLASFLFLQ